MQYHGRPPRDGLPFLLAINNQNRAIRAAPVRKRNRRIGPPSSTTTPPTAGTIVYLELVELGAEGPAEVIGDGNHRLSAMKQLGETITPSCVIEWSSVSPRAQNFYRTRFPDVLGGF